MFAYLNLTVFMNLIWNRLAFMIPSAEFFLSEMSYAVLWSFYFEYKPYILKDMLLIQDRILRTTNIENTD